MRRNVLVCALAAALLPAMPAGAAPRRAAPPAACGMLTQKLADWYLAGAAKRQLNGSRLCSYASGSDKTLEIMSLHVIGPLPPATARADYEAAFQAALSSADTARRLTGLGPRSAFGSQSSDGQRSEAIVTWLDGRWTGVLDVQAPQGYGDAEISDLSRLLQKSIWPRWKHRTP